MHERGKADSGLGREPGDAVVPHALEYACHGAVNDSVFFVSCQPAEVGSVLSLVKEDELKEKLGGRRKVYLVPKILQYEVLHLIDLILVDLFLPAHIVAN